MSRACLGISAALLALLAIAVSGCKPARLQPQPQATRLILDFTPNAAHSGIYLAHQRGLDRAAGADLTIEAPSEPAQGLTQLSNGTVDFALLDINDLAIANAKDPNHLVGILAIIQTPMAAVLTSPAIKRPRDLEGKRAGVSGLPSDRAVLASVVSGDGGNPDLVRNVTVGFKAVPSMLSGSIAGATGFWNVEGRALLAKSPASHEFRIDDYRGPTFPELILVTTHAVINSHPALVDAVIIGLEAGYNGVIAKPEDGVAALVAGAPGTDAAVARGDLAAVLPSFTYKQEKFGMLDAGRLEGWASWAKRFGIVKVRPKMRKLFRGPELHTRARPF